MSSTSSATLPSLDGTDPQFQVGSEFDATFGPNPKEGSPFRFRATRVGSGRAPKVILSNDDRIVAGRTCRVRVARTTRPKQPRRGFIQVEFVHAPPIDVGDDIYIDPALRKRLQVLLEAKRPILLMGPAGCGKNTISEAICRAMSMEWVYFNASCLLESTDWMAQVQLRATPQGGTVTEWIPTPILRTLERAHHERDRLFAIQIDEISRARPTSLSGVFPCIDGTRLYYNPITSSFHPVSPNIVWLAAANVGASYRGTYVMDLALIDRFAPIECSYPPHDAEIKLLQRRFPQLEPKWIHKVVSVANKLRNDPSSPTDISMRATQEVCLLLSHPLYAAEIETHLEEVLRSSFCGRYSGHMAPSGTDSTTVREAIKAALTVERKARGKK